MPRHLTIEQRQQARRLRRDGKKLREIAVEIGCSLRTARRVTCRPGKRETQRIAWSPGPRRLAITEREEISRGLSAGETLRSIARRLGRAPSTISREVKANTGRAHYRAVNGHHGAYARARRPKVAKLTAGPLLSAVETWLEQWWSPEEIANQLRLDHPDDATMRVSHETI